jgi:hypothetical protein
MSGRSDPRTKELLVRMKERNDADPDHGEQCILDPEAASDIQTLQPDVSRPLSPMLRARFEFCSSWSNADLDQYWLSLSEIGDCQSNPVLAEWMRLRAENSYGSDPPGCVEPSHCSIFAYNPFEPDETYLVWKDDEQEPMVWRYFGADYKMFLNLNAYLQYIVGDSSHDDSGRPTHETD